MKRLTYGISAFAMVAATSLGGCATNGKPLTTEQRIAGCAATVIGGGILGALIGSAVDGRGGGGTGAGAAIGAAIGGATCIVWLAFQDEADQRRLAEAQLSAVQSGNPVDDSWTGKDGRVRSVRVVPSTETTAMIPSEAEAGATSQLCRIANVSPSVDGRGAGTMSAVWCRNDANEWAPAEQEMVPA